MQAPAFLARHAGIVERELAALLEQRAHVVPERLLAAMRHSLLAGGKRIRPALLIESSLACEGDEASALRPALAIECMHTYSLIHDDLPCMDDDDLRRGQPTCHRQFDEATAILAGDALQALAFELVAAGGDATAAQLTHALAVAAGGQGMVGGQMLDMQAEAGRVREILEVERIHLHKTGALIRWCCEAGARLAGADDARLQALVRFGEAIGLLFQIADDILDATASTGALGKSAGKDADQRKATYVSLLGLPRARELAAEMHEIALTALAPVGERGGGLKALADYILERGR